MGRKKEKSDEEILAAARSCFIQFGPAVATGVIAKELGVSQATLFNRFNTKRELMFAALGPPERSRLAELLDQDPDSRTIYSQLLEIGEAAVEYFNETDPRLAVLRASGITSDQLNQRYHILPNDLCRQQLSRWITRAQATGAIQETDATVFALAFIGALKSGVDPQSPSRESSDASADENRFSAAYIQGVVDLFWRALNPAKA